MRRVPMIWLGAIRVLGRPGPGSVMALVATIGIVPTRKHVRARTKPVSRSGATVLLREATLDDGAIVDARAGDPVMLGEYNDFGLPKPRPLAENLADGKRMVGPDRGALLVVRMEDQAIIGEVSWHTVGYGPNPESRALNIGVALVPDARGFGHGTEAQRLLAELLFDRYDVERVEASTDVDNLAEQRSLEKAGFTREGVLRRAQFRSGEYHDLVGFSIIRPDIQPSERGSGHVAKRRNQPDDRALGQG